MGAGRFNCVIQSDANESFLERLFHSGLRSSSLLVSPVSCESVADKL